MCLGADVHPRRPDPGENKQTYKEVHAQESVYVTRSEYRAYVILFLIEISELVY